MFECWSGNLWGVGPMAAFWGIILLGLAAVGVGLVLWQRSRPSVGATRSVQTTSSRDAIQVLDTRYARGELSRSEYLAVRDDLLQDQEKRSFER